MQGRHRGENWACPRPCGHRCGTLSAASCQKGAYHSYPPYNWPHSFKHSKPPLSLLGNSRCGLGALSSGALSKNGDRQKVDLAPDTTILWQSFCHFRAAAIDPQRSIPWSIRSPCHYTPPLKREKPRSSCPEKAVETPLSVQHCHVHLSSVERPGIAPVAQWCKP